MLQTVWNELDYYVEVFRITNGIYRAPVMYVAKLWIVVPLNKRYIYCYLKCIVYEDVKTPTIISNTLYSTKLQMYMK
jgi:hypothetical protein